MTLRIRCGESIDDVRAWLAGSPGTVLSDRRTSVHGRVPERYEIMVEGIDRAAFAAVFASSADVSHEVM